MTLQEILADRRSLASGGFAYQPPDDWRQGRTLFGGLSAGLCLDAALQTLGGAPPLRSAQIAFVGPSTGEAEVSCRVLRKGKSAISLACELTSEGQTATTALFVFGDARASAAMLAAERAPPASPPEACPPVFNGPMRPQFSNRFDMRIAAGSGPFTGGEPNISTWVRYADDPSPTGAVAVLTLADAAPPAVMGAMKTPAMISTMTWSFDVLAPELLDEARPWWRMRSATEVTGDGYAQQSMALWTADGLPVARGRQTIAVFG